MAKGGKRSPETEFKPGVSGNPNGRPKGVMNAATRMRKFLDAKMDDVNPVTNEAGTFTVAELMDLKIMARALAGDVQAWDKINDRLEGKAKAQVDMTTNGESINSDPLSALSTQDKADILRKIMKANDCADNG